MRRALDWLADELDLVSSMTERDAAMLLRGAVMMFCLWTVMLIAIPLLSSRPGG